MNGEVDETPSDAPRIVSFTDDTLYRGAGVVYVDGAPRPAEVTHNPDGSIDVTWNAE